MEGNRVFRFWVNSSMRDFHVALAVTAVVAQVIGKISGNPRLPVFGDMVAVFTILHFFVHGYFHRQQRFLTDNQRVYSLPKKKISGIGMKFLAGFLVAVSIGMAVSREIYTGTLLAKVKAMFLYILGAVFGALFGSDGLGRDKLLTQDNTNLLGVMNQVSKRPDSPWENFINSIQTVLIIIGVILLIVLCVMLIVNAVRRLFRPLKADEGKRQGQETEDREETIGGRQAKREKFLDFSPSAKIRRLYRRCINRQKGAGQAIPDCLVPAEIEDMVRLPKEERYRELHELYEKARYSEDGCSDEEARRGKALKV